MNQELEKSIQLRIKILLVIPIPIFLKLCPLYLAKGMQLWKDVKLICILVEEHLRVEEAELAQFLRQVLRDLVCVKETTGSLHQFHIQLGSHPGVRDGCHVAEK